MPGGNPARTGAPALYGRIGYDPDLEAAAFERLAHSDVSGCRRHLGALVDRLDLTAVTADGPQLVQLLVDILQRVNRRVHRGPHRQEAYQAERVALIETFVPCDGPAAARERFVSSLNRLLRGLEPRDRPPHPLLERAKSHIETHYQGRLSLSAIAAELHVSPNHLSRVFRREAGITLTGYIQRVRLEHALMLLADGRQSISEIAYRVGYRNYRDFYRNFVKYENASPRQVRRRLSRAG